MTSILLAVPTVLAVPGAASAAPPGCRASRPALVGPPPGISDSAIGINNRGEVVGAFARSQFDQHAYLRSNGKTRELGSFGGTLTTPITITDSGYVLGNSTIPGDLATHGFLWHRGKLTDLSDAVEPGSPGNPFVQAIAVNERGLVAGYQIDELTTYAVTWRNGRLTRIPTLGGTLPTEPAAVNDAGQVAVSARVPDTENTHAAVWDGRRLRDLGTFGGPSSYASDINAAGHVVGMSTTTDGAVHPFLYRDGKLTDLGLPPGGTWAWADYVNDRDEVAGKWRSADGTTRAFVWARGHFTDLGAGTVARGLNERGQVVGWRPGETEATGTAFVWANGTSITLRGQTPAALTDALAINDRGEVAGATQTNGLSRSVTWTVTCR